MKISNLEEFVKLAETLNFTQAAKSLFITQPALSKHISDLERELGVALFERTQHGVSLTPYGEAFLSDACVVLERYRRAVIRIEKMKSGASEPLRVGYLLGACKPFASRGSALFSARCPNVETIMRAMEVGEIHQALEIGSIDIGITANMNEYPEDLYHVRPLYKDTFALLAPPSHPLASRACVTVQDLAGCQLLLPNSFFTSAWGGIIKDLLDPVRDSMVVHEVLNDVHELPLRLPGSDCCSVSMAHLDNYHWDDVVTVPISGDVPHFDIAVVWARESQRPAFFEFEEAFLEASRR